ncbi:VOC family protein [Actinomadura hibisca]|uniref:VOC family protein n=1 Tax=Actinomadura hibisca TaxID=68565 RepID=UPI000A44657B|nr:VOC family protein [Actinomadura hibisca]
MPSLLRVFVADADKAFSEAVEAGGHVVTPLSDNAFGQRGGRVKDPFGNIWWVTSHVEDVPEAEMWKRLQEPVYAEGMRTAQETLDAELSGRNQGRSSAPVKNDQLNRQRPLTAHAGRGPLPWSADETANRSR